MFLLRYFPPSSIEIVFKREQSSNTLWKLIVCIDFDNVICCNVLQFLKAVSPIDLTFEFGSKTTVCIRTQFSNALSSIISTFLPIVIDVNCFKLANVAIGIRCEWIIIEFNFSNDLTNSLSSFPSW